MHVPPLAIDAAIPQPTIHNIDRFYYTLKHNPTLPGPHTAQELGGVFDSLVGALAAGDLQAVADSAPRLAYYW